MAFLFTAIATDAFTRANETPIVGNWTNVAAAGFNIVSNHVEPSAPGGNDSWAFYNAVAFPSGQYSRAAINCVGTGAGGQGNGLGVRISGAAAVENGYRIVADHAASNNVEVARRVVGVNTTLATFTEAFTNGDQWTLAIGSLLGVWTLYVFHLNILVQTVSDTTPLLTAGGPGLAFSSNETSAQTDDWEGGAFAVTADYDFTLMPKVILRPMPAFAENS